MTGLYYRDEAITLYTGDALETLATLPPGSVHCVVTSPPYGGLRDYGTSRWIGGHPDCAHSVARDTNVPQTKHPRVAYPASAAHRGGDPGMCVRCGAVRDDRQYGLEPTPQAYVDRLRDVFAELRRVLVDEGTVWVNLGDCYSSTSRGAPTGGNPRTSGVRLSRPRAQNFLPDKNLLGMPWRVAFALQRDGWILRNATVWHKPNAMPESVRDRLAARYEMLFLLVKQRTYWFDLDAVREPLTHPGALDRGIVIGGSRKGRHAGIGARARRRGHNTYGEGKYAAAVGARGSGPGMRPTGHRHDSVHPRGKNPGDVWSTRPLRAAHFAPFPVDLPLRCIAAGCPPGGVVLDPFSGAATTGLAARHLARAYIGIDLNSEFHAIGLARLGLDQPETGTGEQERPAA